MIKLYFLLGFLFFCYLLLVAFVLSLLMGVGVSCFLFLSTL